MSTTLATSERYRDRDQNWVEQTDWHNIVVWGNLANDIADGRRNYSKGDLMYVEGKLRTRQWTDQTGNKRYTTEVVADSLQLLGKRPEGENQPQGGYQGGYAQQPAAPAAQPASPAAQPAYQPAQSAPQAAPAPQPAAPAYQGPLPAAEPSDDLPF